MMTRCKHPSVWLSLGSILVGLCVARPALGQASPGASSTAGDVNAQVTASYERGIKAAKANQWQKAREAFLHAWELKQHYQIAANLGRAELKLKMYRDAAEHLSYFLREAKDISTEDRGQAQKLFDEARAKIASITVQVNVPGAEVLIDGSSVGEAPLPGPVFVEPGRRTVYSRSGGYKSSSSPVDAAAGGSHEVSLELVKDEPIPQPKPVIEKPQPKPPERGGPNTALMVAGIAAGAVTIGGGVGFAIASHVNGAEANKAGESLGESSEVCKNNPLPECISLQRLRTTQNTLGNAALWTLSAGGGIGVATLVYVLAAPKAKSESALRVVPAPTAQGGSLVITGTW